MSTCDACGHPVSSHHWALYDHGSDKDLQRVYQCMVPKTVDWEGEKIYGVCACKEIKP